jgi:hypothetical protein
VLQCTGIDGANRVSACADRRVVRYVQALRDLGPLMGAREVELAVPALMVHAHKQCKVTFVARRGVGLLPRGGATGMLIGMGCVSTGCGRRGGGGPTGQNQSAPYYSRAAALTTVRGVGSVRCSRGNRGWG